MPVTSRGIRRPAIRSTRRPMPAARSSVLTEPPCAARASVTVIVGVSDVAGASLTVGAPLVAGAPPASGAPDVAGASPVASLEAGASDVACAPLMADEPAAAGADGADADGRSEEHTSE